MMTGHCEQFIDSSFEKLLFREMSQFEDCVFGLSYDKGMSG